MRHAPCLLTPARALHRVLVIELANTTGKANGSFSTALPPACAFFPAAHRHASLPPPIHARGRGTGTASCCQVRAFSATPATAAGRMLGGGKLPRDQDIRYRWVRVADGSGSLSPPQRTDDVLARLPAGHSLVMVSPPPPPPTPAPGAPAAVLQPSAAICRIIDAAAEAAAAKSAEKEEKRLTKHTKQLEVNWAVAPHDLGHKVKRLHEFLGKGYRVELLLARKKGSRKATPEEAQELVRHVQEAALQVQGVSEYKKMDGAVGGVLKMFFEGPQGKKKTKKENGSGDMDKA
ncbi:hypothetical protein F4802DRAFT_191667 [Xylaria palmicola]|nr:hypothetical protein F4802DRAFT_191667 [Xylaria palmicola]